MPAYQLDQFLPDIDPSCWIAPCATIIGNVVVGSGSSIWFGSVVRGDNEPIVIGERINIQDGFILHSDPGSPLRIGNDTTVGHRAVVHGCTIGTASVADRPRLDATPRRDSSGTPNFMQRCGNYCSATPCDRMHTKDTWSESSEFECDSSWP